jgi:hypothetical protein
VVERAPGRYAMSASESGRRILAPKVGEVLDRKV